MTPIVVNPSGGPGKHSIQLKLRDPAQLFNSMDPSPFDEKDLDHDAEEFIVSWARELPPNDPLHLMVHFERPLPPDQNESSIGDSVHHYFDYRASINRLELRQLLKQGRLSLIIGVAFLLLCISGSRFTTVHFGSAPFSATFSEGLTIAGWVAMWRPMEVFLYDWWPIKRRGALLQRLSQMEIQVRFAK